MRNPYVVALTPSNVLNSQQLLSEFEQFIRRGPWEDAIKLLKHLSQQHTAKQTLQPSLNSSPPQPLPRQLLCNPTPSRCQPEPELKIYPWRPPTPPSSPVPLPTPDFPSILLEERSQIEGIAKHYFRWKGVKDTARLERLTKISAQLLGDRSEPNNNIWSVKYDIFSTGGSRIARLEGGRRAVDTSEHNLACAGRLVLLYIAHELDETASTINVPGVRRSTAAIEKYAADSGRKKESIKNDRKYGRHYLSLLQNSGPGDVLCLNLSSDTWTRKVVDGEVELALEFRKLVLQTRDVESQKLEAAKAQRLNILGAKLIIEGFLRYGWDYEGLSRCQGRVMMALFNHIDRSELAKGNVGPKREAIDRQSVSGGIPPTPRGPNRANRTREGSIFNPQGEASAPPNSPKENVNEGIAEDCPSDYGPNHGTSMGGGGQAFDGIPSARCETTPGSDTDGNTQRSSPSPSAEGDLSNYGPHPEGDSTDSVETTTSPTPHSETNSEFDNFQRLDMLVEAAKVFAKATNKRPYPADSGSQGPDSRRRRLSEEREGDNPSTGGVPTPQSREAGFTSTRNPSSIFQDSSYSTAEGATESRQQLFPENQPSQPDARRSPRANNTTLLNTAQPPTAISLELDSNCMLDPTSLDRSALYQSPQNTLSINAPGSNTERAAGSWDTTNSPTVLILGGTENFTIGIDTLKGGSHQSLNGEQEARIQAALNAKPFVDPVLMNPMLSHDDPALAPSPEPIIMNQIINDVNDIHRPPSPPSSQVMNELLSLHDQLMASPASMS